VFGPAFDPDFNFICVKIGQNHIIGNIGIIHGQKQVCFPGVLGAGCENDNGEGCGRHGHGYGQA
jgi:hypothetical protein